MNCEQARDLAALAASGDVTPIEQHDLESHISGCVDCCAEAKGFEDLRGQLAIMREEAVPAHVYAAVRARVAAEIDGRRRRSGWFVAWPAFVAVVACTVVLAVTLRPKAPVATQPSRYRAADPVAIAGLQEPASPVPVAAPLHGSRHPRARIATRQPAEPLVVHMFTSDPDVVIYWIADARGNRKKEIIQ